MIKIILADDHDIVRKGIKLIFSETEDLRVEAEAVNGNDLIMQVENNDFDVAILDISMPGLDGLDTLKELKKVKPQLPVIVFTMFSEELYAMRVIKNGASGYLSKDKDPKELINAVRKVTQGKMYLSPELAQILAESIAKDHGTTTHKDLSDREFQVMRMIAVGKNLTEISEELSLSLNTVSTYRLRLLEKLNLKSNVEIAHYAVKNGIIKI